MPEDQKSGFSEAVETGASAAHTIRGAIKTGKAISSAAKGAAAGGPYGAVAGAVWAGRKHIGIIDSCDTTFPIIFEILSGCAWQGLIFLCCHLQPFLSLAVTAIIDAHRQVNIL